MCIDLRTCVCLCVQTCAQACVKTCVCMCRCLKRLRHPAGSARIKTMTLAQTCVCTLQMHTARTTRPIHLARLHVRVIGTHGPPPRDGHVHGLLPRELPRGRPAGTPGSHKCPASSFGRTRWPPSRPFVRGRTSRLASGSVASIVPAHRRSKQKYRAPCPSSADFWAAAKRRLDRALRHGRFAPSQHYS